MASKYSNRRDDEKREPSAPKMTRSRGQLAVAYAPGAIFTFEGGLGACLSIPDQGRNPDLARVAPETMTQIHLRLREVWQNWFTRAMESGTPQHPALPVQCLDQALLRDNMFHVPPTNRFELVDAKVMGYVPAPLDFVCNTCGRFQKYDSVKEASSKLNQLDRDNCDTRRAEFRGKCKWRQLDVIFVHWSGNWAAPTPGRWEWSVEKQEALPPIGACALCQSRKFYLVDKSPRIGEWVFECENGHKDGNSWLQNDEVTTRLLGDECRTRPPRWRRMEPISYRATPAFYPHSEQFVVLAADQRDLLLMLQDGHQEELAGFASERFGLGATPLSIQDILDVLRKAGQQNKVSQYERIETMRDKLLGTSMADELSAQLRDMVEDWKETPGLIPMQHEAPAWLKVQINRRFEFGSRYDPLVLAVEHEALRRSKLDATHPVDGRSPFVRFTHPDKDLAPRTQGQLEEQTRRTAQLLSVLGMEEMGLIREFDLCRFTHGYTRMSTDPIIEKSDQQQLLFPVRLNLFQELGNGKIPIYVVTQANEAIYVKLRPQAVYAWLREVGVADLPDLDPTENLGLGAHVLQSAAPFGKYFSDLQPGPANSYRYVYTLLHTYAHTVMKAVAELSGLDLGSLGEYLFPADFAFVVYRNGTTMDLGNLSALWRNYNTTFLEQLLEPRALMCGAGSLCDASGGACPSCIVIPETSCIAANQLLSRSVLRSGPAPREDQPHQTQRIIGYLDVTTKTIGDVGIAR
ncbi:hypothetical protein [Caballeronia sp. 15711]|uniref:hypothetical protein n=1 Tax=Caballeronia sp. 15711 TaxID=3391029 RepID=UPI0039E39311